MVRDGLFSFDHARVIAETVEALPEDLRARFEVPVEERLVVHAPELNPLELQKLAGRITTLLDEDGPEPKGETQYRRRGLRFTVLPDGSSIINGRLTAAATAAWSVILAALAKQRNVEVDEDDQLIHGDDQLGKDTRTESQGLHDAAEEAGQLLLETGKLPDHAGLKADLIVTIDLRDLEQRTGRATTHHGGTLTTQQLAAPSRRYERHPRHPRPGPRPRRTRKRPPPGLPDPAESHLRPRPGLHLPRLRPISRTIPDPPPNLPLPR